MQNSNSNSQHEYGNSSRVQVVVRVRPVLPNEKIEDVAVTCSEDASRVQVLLPDRLASGNQLPGSLRCGARSYAFDACLNGSTTQSDLFDACGMPELINAALDGYCVTVFAFGQTGSGKTHTMIGAQLSRSSKAFVPDSGIGSNSSCSNANLPLTSDPVAPADEDDGLLSRCITHAFEAIKIRNGQAVFTVTATCVELYNENVTDLLGADKSKTLQVRQDKRDGFQVDGLAQVNCPSAAKALRCMCKALQHRQTRGHKLNEYSSRSHCLMTFVFSSTEVDGEQQGVKGGMRRYGKLTLVDLAGSERLKDTGSTGRDAVRETGAINKSLFTLGQVLCSLCAKSGGASVHIPYRDSKLTQLLWDGLRGSGRALMLGCLGPQRQQAEESLNTLHFASMALRIKSQPVVLLDPQPVPCPSATTHIVHRLRSYLALSAARTTVRLQPGVLPIWEDGHDSQRITDRLVMDLRQTIDALRNENRHLSGALQQLICGADAQAILNALPDTLHSITSASEPASGAGTPPPSSNEAAPLHGLLATAPARVGRQHAKALVVTDSVLEVDAEGSRDADSRAALDCGTPTAAVAEQRGVVAGTATRVCGSCSPYVDQDTPSSPKLAFGRLQAQQQAQAGRLRASGATSALGACSTSCAAAGGARDLGDAAGQRRTANRAGGLTPPLGSSSGSVKGSSCNAGGGNSPTRSQSSRVPHQPRPDRFSGPLAAPPGRRRGGSAPGPQTAGASATDLSNYPELAAMEALFQKQLEGMDQGGPGASTVVDVSPPVEGAPEPKALSWAECNTWFGVHMDMTTCAYTAHDALVGMGVDPASDHYYEEIERRVSRQFPAEWADFQATRASGGGGRAGGTAVAAVSAHRSHHAANTSAQSCPLKPRHSRNGCIPRAQLAASPLHTSFSRVQRTSVKDKLPVRCSQHVGSTNSTPGSASTHVIGHVFSNPNIAQQMASTVLPASMLAALTASVELPPSPASPPAPSPAPSPVPSPASVPFQGQTAGSNGSASPATAVTAAGNALTMARTLRSSGAAGEANGSMGHSPAASTPRGGDSTTSCSSLGCIAGLIARPGSAGGSIDHAPRPLHDVNSSGRTATPTASGSSVSSANSSRVKPFNVRSMHMKTPPQQWKLPVHGDGVKHGWSNYNNGMRRSAGSGAGRSMVEHLRPPDYAEMTLEHMQAEYVHQRAMVLDELRQAKVEAEQQRKDIVSKISRTVAGSRWRIGS